MVRVGANNTSHIPLATQFLPTGEKMAKKSGRALVWQNSQLRLRDILAPGVCATASASASAAFAAVAVSIHQTAASATSTTSVAGNCKWCRYANWPPFQWKKEREGAHSESCANSPTH